MHKYKWVLHGGHKIGTPKEQIKGHHINSIFTGAPIKFSNSEKAPQETEKTKIPVWVLVHVMSKLNFMSKLNPKLAHCLLTVIDSF